MPSIVNPVRVIGTVTLGAGPLALRSTLAAVGAVADRLVKPQPASRAPIPASIQIYTTRGDRQDGSL